MNTNPKVMGLSLTSENIKLQLDSVVFSQMQKFNALPENHLLIAGHYFSCLKQMVETGQNAAAFVKSLTPEIRTRIGLPSEEEFKVTAHRLEYAVEKLLRDLDYASLADGRRNNGRKWEIDDWVVADILSSLIEDSTKSLTTLHDALLVTARARKQDCPSYHAVRRFVLRMNERKLLQVLRASLKTGTYKDFGIKLARDLPYSQIEIQLDSHLVDVLVPAPNNELIRPWLTSVVDATTNMPLGWHLTPHKPMGRDQMIALYKALLAKGGEKAFGGYFPVLVTDNAPEYKRNPDFKSCLMRLNIGHRFIAKKQSPQNGSVERSFGVFEKKFCDQFPIWLKKGRRITNHHMFTGNWEGVLRAVDEFFFRLNYEENHQGHGEPRYATWYRMLQPEYPRWLPQEYLDEVMFTTDTRIVHDGRVTIDGAHYTTPEFAGLNGEKVLITIGLNPDKPILKAYHREQFLGILDRARSFDLSNLVGQANISQSNNTAEIAAQLKKLGISSRKRLNRSAHDILRFSHFKRRITKGWPKSKRKGDWK